MGWKFAHPLYVYKIEIVKIMAFIDEKSNKSKYSNAKVFIKPFISKENNQVQEFEEYEMDTDVINKDKWFLIENMKG
ncbi:hypothetical protein [Bacillus bingmayongensis]|uniref:hypothetical protein n=1 Tax=Bacillus bingmayongensis TaxID=1150157 RepID=UPI000845C0C0|nr:hypothetical protein [Bacillus bingmayongensis]